MSYPDICECCGALYGDCDCHMDDVTDATGTRRLCDIHDVECVCCGKMRDCTCSMLWAGGSAWSCSTHGLEGEIEA